MHETVMCPYCFEGSIYEMCRECDGHGCDTCGTSGEIVVDACTFCNGSGEVRRALARLREADVFISGHDPAWQGDASLHPGTTDYSLAAFYRVRDKVGRVDTVRGVTNDHGTQEVWLFTQSLGVVRLPGFSWGYGGTGPSGLAVVLAYLDFFDSVDEAREWASKQPTTKPWALRKAELEV